MAENDVQLFISIETDQAKKDLLNFRSFTENNIKAFQASLSKGEQSVKGFGDAFGSIKSGLLDFNNTIKNFALPITAAVGAGVVAFNHLKTSINEAVQDAKEIKQIRASLLATGEASETAVKDVIAFADAIRETTTLDDGLVRSLFITAKSFGVTNEEAKKLTKAAIDLSAATGKDVETALEQLGRTLDGSIGKIGDLGDEFRGLTETQLRSLGAIDLVNEKFGGTSEKNATGYQASLNRLSNSFRDLQTSIGQTITDSVLLQTTFDSVAEAITKAANKIADKTSLGEQLTNSGINVVRGTGSIEDVALKKFEEDTAILNSLVSNLQADERVRSSAGGFLKSLEDGSFKIEKTVKPISAAAKAAAAEFKKAREDAQKYITGLISSSGSEVEQIGNKAREQFDKVTELRKKELITYDQAEKARLAIATEVNEKIGKLNKQVSDENLKNIEREEKRREEADKKQKEQLELLASSASAAIAGATSGDKKSQFQGIGSIISGVLQAYLGPLGAVLGQFITALSVTNKENAKEFAKQFIESVPEFVKTVAENAPAFAAGLIQAFTSKKFWESAANAFVAILPGLYGFLLRLVDEFLDGKLSEYGTKLAEKFTPRVVEGLQNFADNFVNTFANFGDGLATVFEEAGQNIYNGIADGFRNFFNNVGNVFREAAIEMRDAFFEPVQRLIDFLDGFKFPDVGLGGGGGGDNVFEQGRKKLGLAKGGIVPAYAASGMFVPQGTDTVPAMLTPGELVVPRDMVGQLGQFLDTGSTGGQQEAILMAILQAVQSPMTVQSEVKVKEQAFADIILQLNRQNARLSA